MMNRLLLTILALSAWIAPLDAQQKAHSTLFARTDGSDVKAVVRIEVDSGWHLFHEAVGNGYGKETTLEWSGEGITWSPTRFPTPEKHFEQGLEGPLGGPAWEWVHEGTVLLYARGRVASGTPDPSKVSVTIDGQTCDKSCILYH